MIDSPTQCDRMLALLEEQTLARACDLKTAGIAATTIARAVNDGEVVRVSRGLYQLPGTEVDSAFALAEASKRVPKGIICMMSALAFHGLTDQMPRVVWIAIGAKSWQPKVDYPPLHVVRFAARYLDYGIESHLISGIPVLIYSVPKTLADAFRHPKLVNRSVAIECLRNALKMRKAAPAAIAEAARDCGAWNKMQPYLEAMTSDG